MYIYKDTVYKFQMFLKYNLTWNKYLCGRVFFKQGQRLAILH